MNQAALEAAFKEWWEASYGRPPGTHAVMTHAAFAAYILQLIPPTTRENGMTDMVNHPPHYKQGGVECIKAIHAALGDKGFIAYCKGNVIKYLWRAEHKGNRNEDLARADWYMRQLLMTAERNDAE